ncbi:hypothetical protein FISHEDRAFT_38262, partial [Fistulina hepatica ATCC 64428]
EYDTVLEEISNTDVVLETLDWSNLKSMIKHKITSNISLFLKETKSTEPPAPFAPQHTASGDLRLAPFPHDNRRNNTLSAIEIPIAFMNEQQADELKNLIFEHLDDFAEGPPFTLQRVCELCLKPREHYNSVGKYLRAVERTILVTSTHKSFPVLSEHDKIPNLFSSVSFTGTSSAPPQTPMFSPIPFLHGDARLDSPRNSPLILPSSASGDPAPLQTRALGLVDELDDPRPGHMSDTPTPLTSAGSTSAASSNAAQPVLGSLVDRFVSSTEEEQPSERSSTNLATSTTTSIDGTNGITVDALDGDEDKENAKM